MEGRQEEILNITLSAVGDTEIVFDVPVLSMMVQNEDDEDMFYRANEDDSAYFTIKKGTNFAQDFSRYATKSCGWLRASSGTGPAQVIGARSS